MSNHFHTRLDVLNQCNLETLIHNLKEIGFGNINAAVSAPPVLNARSALASDTTQEHDTTSTILAVSTGGTGLNMVPAGVAPAATEVAVSYDAAGVATLEFNSAVTEYSVQEKIQVAGVTALLAENAGA